VSEGVARDLRSFGQFSPHKVSVVHNPVFDPDIAELARQEPLHPWLLAGDPPIILAAGRLHPQKGFDVLLRAFARVRAQIDCRLVILGEGAERASLAAMASDIGLAYDVDFPGFARNPFSLMARAAVFVLSSRWEGFPNALVEAMASGAPVVSTDCPSGPREILDHGRYGRLVPPGSAELLADAILAVLRERPDTTASRRRAEMFSVAAATRQYLDLLEAAP
ncbi:MAG TPA: glycosyltransferase, partial [Rhizomicrobium sp.]|nr:glycosyltransferase [Rhizomicrobium sp.]